MNRNVFAPLLVLVGIVFQASAAEPARRTWTVDAVEREGLVYAPETARTEPTPLVFVFHGHGGSMSNAARSFRTHALWPEAMVVYLQGLPTPGRITDPEGKRVGWQATIGAQGDRDVKFFDAALASLKADYKVDAKRVYCTGHSNGGAFTYQLWAVRGDVFAAVAPSAAAANDLVAKLKPKPMLHLAAENDPLVKFAWQKATIDAVMKLNGCDPAKGKKQGERTTVYPSDKDVPVQTYLHDNGHAFPPEAAGAVAEYFKGQGKTGK